MSEVPVTPPPAPAPAGGTVAAPAGTDYPGKTLGIVGLVLSIIVSLVGLIISIIAFNQSKSAGYKNTPAKAGIIIGIILLALSIIISIVSSIAAAALVNSSLN